MKILLVGGAHQGKGEYARRVCGGADLPDLHLLVRERLADRQRTGQESVWEELLEEIVARRDWVITCDEIGLGLIPVDRFDRRWREEVGRLCCALAERADVVERIVCGLPLRLKGGEGTDDA